MTKNGALLSFDEIRAGVVGSWRVLRGDPQGMRCFDCSVDGFWRSFGVFVPLLLPVLVNIAAQRRLHLIRTGMDPRDFPDVVFVILQIGGFGVAWFGFPLLLAAVAGPLGIAPRFSPLVVVRNWASLIGIVPYFVATILFAAGLLTPQGLGLMSLGAFVFNVFLSYRVARLAAGAPPGLASGLVALDFVFTILIATVADRLVGI